MVGKLIVSIDCEGRWGIADRGNERLAQIDNDGLRRAYSDILGVLHRHNASATFAFVAALCMEEDELLYEVRRCGDAFRLGGHDWLAPARKSMEESLFSGWSVPELVLMVAGEGRHHICSHGGFHIPYDEGLVSKESVEEDLRLVKKLQARHKIDSSVLVFPRNVIGFKSLLSEGGFRGYREIDRCEKMSGFTGKAKRLINEFSSSDRNDMSDFSHQANQGLVGLSPGKFLNAKIGVRRFVPVSATKKRIDALLRSAIENGSIVHLYTHPHNFITDKTMVDKFDYLFWAARGYERKGMLNIATMGDELNEQGSSF